MVRGSRSSVGADAGTVARMVELVSCFSGLDDGTVARMVELVSRFSGLSDHAPLSSYAVASQ